MSDRLLRDSLEQTQTELRDARAELAIPLEDSKLKAEVDARLAELAPERDRLVELIRGTRGLRVCAEEAKVRANLEQSLREDRTGPVEALGVVALVCAYAWAGTAIGEWLAFTGFDPTIALALGVLACPLVFFDLSGLIQWLRRGD